MADSSPPPNNRRSRSAPVDEVQVVKPRGNGAIVWVVLGVGLLGGCLCCVVPGGVFAVLFIRDEARPKVSLAAMTVEREAKAFLSDIATGQLEHAYQRSTTRNYRTRVSKEEFDRLIVDQPALVGLDRALTVDAANDSFASVKGTITWAVAGTTNIQMELRMENGNWKVDRFSGETDDPKAAIAVADSFLRDLAADQLGYSYRYRTNDFFKSNNSISDLMKQRSLYGGLHTNKRVLQAERVPGSNEVIVRGTATSDFGSVCIITMGMSNERGSFKIHSAIFESPKK